MSLPRDRFWDIQVSKIDSPTRQPLLPRPSCVRAASPHLRKLGAGYAALPQMTGHDFSYAYFVSPLRYRTPDKQCGPGRYRGLTAFASLSMAVSDRASGRMQQVAGLRLHQPDLHDHSVHRGCSCCNFLCALRCSNDRIYRLSGQHSEGAASCVSGLITEFLFDLHQVVVFGHPVGTAQGTGLDLSCACRHH